MKRYDLIDTLRGVAIISMIAFHTCWLLNYFGMAISTQALYGPVFNIWERSICISFILISGYCFSLGRHHLRSGLTVFGAGLVITLVTCIFLPGIRIVFGVLTFIGTAILITIPVDRLAKDKCESSKMVCRLMLVLALAAFLFTYNINMGYLGFGWMRVDLPEGLYKGYIATFVGFMEAGFVSADYFSLMPWYFLYLSGYALHKVINDAVADSRIMKMGIPGVKTLGRHSLLVYILHPVVIYLILFTLKH